MAKKKMTRKQRREAAQKKQTTKIQSRASVPAGASPDTSNAVEKLRGREFNPDYSYVFDDLRRIAFLATFFVAALVVLSFILN